MLYHIKSRYILCLIIVLVSCQSKKKADTIIDSNFETIESRNNFLETISDSDQGIRDQNNSANFNEQENHEFWVKVVKTDSINLIKIDHYLNQFGYPDTINYTEKARKAPWYVIQHCTKLDSRIKYYNLLKRAYESGEIRNIDFYLYLQRNYYFKNKKMLGIENNASYTFEEKIAIFQDALGYEK